MLPKSELGWTGKDPGRCFRVVSVFFLMTSSCLGFVRSEGDRTPVVDYGDAVRPFHMV